jgi:hypothetical protein
MAQEIKATIRRYTINATLRGAGLSLAQAQTHFYTESEIDDLLASYALTSHVHDDRYFTESEVTALLLDKSNVGHLHDDRYYTEAEVVSFLADKADVGHTHDTRYYTETEIDTIFTDYLTETEINTLLSGYSPTSHNHDSRYYTETEINTLLTGYSVTSHTHDSRYYTETEVDGLLDDKADTVHTHDDRYFTESEITTLLAGKSDTGHSHNDLYYTESEVDGLLDDKLDVGTTTTDIAEGSNLYYTNSRADARITAQKAQANGLATLDGGGKIPTSQLPALAISETFVVNSEANMLASGAQTGDVAIRTDENKSYILAGSDPTELTDWQELLTPTDAVSSVNGQTGAVTLTTTHIAEGTNEYYTQGKFDTAFGNKDTDDLSEGSTNKYYSQTLFDASLATKDTDDLPEGSTNQYFTNERVDDRVASLLVEGAGITLAYDDVLNTLTISADAINWGDIGGTLSDQSDLQSALDGKSDDGHTHDDRYYTETEVDAFFDDYLTESEITTLLSGKSDTGHNHNDLYYTETEIDALLADYSLATHNHDSRYYTEAEIDTFLSGKSDTGHTHTATNITDFAEAVDDRINGLIVEGAGIDVTYNDGANTFTIAGVDASLTVKGIVEIATGAETTTGTDATRAVSPDGLAGSDYGKRVVQVLVSDPNGDAITTGDGKAYFAIPPELNGYNLVDADAVVTTASSSGLPTIQVHNVTDAVDMLSTRITIDASEFTSYTAVTAPVINTSNDDVATGDRLRIDIDVAGTGTKGLIVLLSFQKP